jgi:GT2 family glycosyltransferase
MRTEMEERVGVVVVNWNSGPHLDRCLRALAGQTLAPRRVLVLDNASADGSEGAAQGRPGVELLRLGANLGFAAANNRGIERADDCEWIALLNPDAFPEPGWLEALTAAARREPRFAFLASRQVSADDPSRLDGTGDVYTVAGLAWRRHHDHPAQGAAAGAEEVFSPCAAAGLYRRDALLEAGGFDEAFFCYFEDVDLAFRMRLLGHRCLYVPEAVVHHVGSSSTGRGSAFSIYHGHRNLVWTWFKDMPGPLLLLHGPMHLLLNVASLAWFGLQGHGRTIVRAKWDALCGLPRVWRQRKAVQARRRATSGELRQAMVGGLRTPGFRRREI